MSIDGIFGRVRRLNTVEGPPGMFPIRVGAYELDLRSRELRDGATRIRLQGQPFEILRALLERPETWSHGKNCGTVSGQGASS